MKKQAPKHTNRLAQETSPYLLQHAQNPVDWYPWGEEAFAEARRRDVPIFLSVGYSTCHWCHVMESESFEDAEIAAVLNRSFVPVKVDREERPDVDGVYMTAVQAMSGSGGWPMSVFMTADGAPFFAGTYFPPRDGVRGARVGFLTLLLRIADTWQGERARVEQSAADIRAELLEVLRPPAPADLPPLATVDRAVQAVAARYDEIHGGLSGAPKFPSSLPARLLLRHHRRTHNARSLQMATTTLLRMAAGGMYDHVAGGFHRYSVDERWLVPHFEKMLYDNALLVMAYVDAWRATGNDAFSAVAQDVLSWLTREMSSSDGGFFSATDADSVGPSGHAEEGYYFTWTQDELRGELGEDDARVAQAIYGVTARGNFEGRCILTRTHDRDRDPDRAALARDLSLSASDLESALKRIRAQLLIARSERPRPLRDDKVIAAWNGLAISAYARAGFAFADAALLERATTAAASLLRNLQRADGRLQRTHKDGVARHAGTLEDHAFVCQGLLDLFEASGEVRWLKEAMRLDDVIERHFADRDRGGYFLTPDDGEVLLAREKPDRDGAEPSGNSVHALSLVRLCLLTGDDNYRVRAERTVQAFAQILEKHPLALCEMLLALELLHGLRGAGVPPVEVVVVHPAGDIDSDVLGQVRRAFFDGVVVHGPEARLQGMAKRVALVQGRTLHAGHPTVYVCEGGVCQLPEITAAGVRRALTRGADPAGS